MRNFQRSTSHIFPAILTAMKAHPDSKWHATAYAEHGANRSEWPASVLTNGAKRTITLLCCNFTETIFSREARTAPAFAADNVEQWRDEGDARRIAGGDHQRL